MSSPYARRYPLHAAADDFLMAPPPKPPASRRRKAFAAARIIPQLKRCETMLWQADDGEIQYSSSQESLASDTSDTSEAESWGSSQE